MSCTRYLLRTTSTLQRRIVGSIQPLASFSSSAQADAAASVRPVATAASVRPVATNNQVRRKAPASPSAKPARTTFQSRKKPVPVADKPVALAHHNEEVEEPQFVAATFQSRKQPGPVAEKLAEVAEKKPVVHHNEEIEEPQFVALPTTCWVVINSVPPLATLEDVTSSVDKVLDVEREIGILDVDALGTGDKLDLDPDVPWVKSAQVLLSTHGRPTRWGIELANRSIVHAFLEHTKENRFMCVWKESSVEAWDPDSRGDQIEVNNSMIRVENCPASMTADHVRHLFRRYDFARGSPSVTEWKVETSKHPHYMFLVHFADPSWARAAVREMQGIEVGVNQLRLAQYPKQLL